MLSRPKRGPNARMRTCRGRESMSCPNAREQFAGCSMLSDLCAWQSPAVVRARKHATQRALVARSRTDMELLSCSAQRRQRHVPIAVKRVVSTKGHHVAARQQVRQAAFHDAARVKGVHVEKGGQHDAEHIGPTQFLFERFDDEVLERRIGRPAALRAAATAASPLQVFEREPARRAGV